MEKETRVENITTEPDLGSETSFDAVYGNWDGNWKSTPDQLHFFLLWCQDIMKSHFEMTELLYAKTADKKKLDENAIDNIHKVIEIEYQATMEQKDDIDNGFKLFLDKSHPSDLNESYVKHAPFIGTEIQDTQLKPARILYRIRGGEEDWKTRKLMKTKRKSGVESAEPPPTPKKKKGVNK
jgi:hypothetical protein